MKGLSFKSLISLATAVPLAMMAQASVAFYSLNLDMKTVLCDPANADSMDAALRSYCGFESLDTSAPPLEPVPVVTLQFSSSSSWVPRSGSTTVSWSSTGATQCAASGAWSGSKALSGAINTAPLLADQTYSLQCRNEQHSALASITVRVRQAILSWEPPVTNTDGTDIADLSGYRVYWGPSSRQYQNSADVPDPGQTSMVVALTPGVHYFAVTALNAEGFESGYSNEAQKEIR